MPAPVLDPARLAKLHRLGGRELVVQLLDSFLAETPVRRAALQGADLAATGAVAHQLVAGAGQLGAGALAEIARQVDEGVRTGDPTLRTTLIPQLRSAFDEAVTALEHARETA
jgi:HPt (histidine-containing phosphotransfer) domain-containing protein